MKKLYKIAIALCTLGVSLNSHAQESKGYTSFSINAGYDLGLKSNQPGLISIQPEFGKFFNNQFYAGIGSGFIVDDKFNTASVPIFLRTEIDFPARKITPFVSLLAGYNICVSGDNGAGRINPSVGFKVPVAKNTDFNLSFGYTHDFYNGFGSDFLGVKTGFSFNSGGKGFSDFLKTLEYTAELETFTPFSVEKSYSSDIEKITAKNTIGVRFSALAPILVDNLYAGISLGVGHYTEKHENSFDGIKESYNESGVYGNAMARIKYKAKQITIADKIYPYAQVDAGSDIFWDAIFSVQPALGIAIETGNDKSIDISVGYATKSIEDTNKGCIRIAAGYTF